MSIYGYPGTNPQQNDARYEHEFINSGTLGTLGLAIAFGGSAIKAGAIDSVLSGMTAQAALSRFSTWGLCFHRSSTAPLFLLQLIPCPICFSTPERQMHTPGLKVEEASSIGAGDSFVGGMTLALQRGEDIHRAFLYGMAAGTAALMTKGTELCRKDDTERFYRRLLDTQGKTV